MTRPLPPFDSWPIELDDPRFGFRWFRKPAIMIDHLTVAHGTVPMVQAMMARLDEMIAEHRRDIEAAKGILIIGDWRRVTSYDPPARQLFLKELQKPRKIRGSVVILSKAGAFLKMAVQAASMVAAVVGAPSIAVSEDVNAVLRKHSVDRDA
ncbi:hypothetical protein BH09MYX1_BH09MYX1_18340 [soil metagenome]